jgi:carboxyl-terminal processing protease
MILACVIALDQQAPSAAPAGLAARIWEITDAVLDHHINPATRPQMILDGLEGVYQAAGAAVPAGLARRVSTITSPEQLTPLLDEVWRLMPPAGLPKPGRELGPDNPLIDALLGKVPSQARLLSERDLKVEEQFAGNRYVGLQIALGIDSESKRAMVNEVFEGGPADKAGLKKGDLIEEIDGTSTEGADVREVVERLRGAEGTSVTIRVRQQKQPESRVLTITRGVLPRQTVKGFRNRADGSLELLIPGPERIGYLKFEEILGSTPHELRVLASRLEDEDAQALILDLRPVSQGRVDLHSTILLADCLLEGGTIGRVRSARGEEVFQAEPDALCRERLLFVLVDSNTPATAEWLAAALQDNHRAIVVGPPKARVAPGPRSPRPRPGPGPGPALMIAREANVRSVVPVGDGAWSIEMTTGRLARGDGRPLAGDRSNGNGALLPDITVGRLAPGNSSAPETDPLVRGDAILSEAIRQLRVVLRHIGQSDRHAI